MNITPPTRNLAAKMASRLRSKNKLNGTMGFSAVRSTTANATKAASATRPEPIVVADSQPFSGPIEQPKTAAVKINVASTAPVASSFIRSFWVSRSEVRARKSVSSPIGTLTKNASRHDTSVSTPPTTRPITAPTPAAAPDTAAAALRSGPFGNVVATSAKPVGAAIARATPLSSRATTRAPPSQAMPHMTEAMVNSATPMMKARLRPMVSPRRPPSSSSPPKASMEAVITQLRPASDRPSSFWILGSATTVMVVSIPTISCMVPIAITAATNRRRGSQVGKDRLEPLTAVCSTGMGTARSTRCVVKRGSERSSSLRAVIADHPTVLVRGAAVVRC